MRTGNRRRRHRPQQSRAAVLLSIGAVVIVGIGAAGLASAAIAQTETHKVDPSALRDQHVVEVEAPAEQVHTQLADVLPRLRDEDRAFNVVVFSDSTGAGRNTWTALTGEWLGEKYNRTVKGVQWDIHQEPNGYRGAEWNLAPGRG